MTLRPKTSIRPLLSVSVIALGALGLYAVVRIQSLTAGDQAKIQDAVAVIFKGGNLEDGDAGATDKARHTKAGSRYLARLADNGKVTEFFDPASGAKIGNGLPEQIKKIDESSLTGKERKADLERFRQAIRSTESNPEAGTVPKAPRSASSRKPDPVALGALTSGGVQCGGPLTTPPIPAITKINTQKDPATQREPAGGNTPIETPASDPTLPPVEAPVTEVPTQNPGAGSSNPAAPTTPGQQSSSPVLVLGGNTGARAVQPQLDRTGEHLSAATEELARQAFFDSLMEKQREISRAAKQDEQKLARPYQAMPIQALGAALKRADEALTTASETFQRAVGGLDSSDLKRFRNLFQDAGAKARYGSELIEEGLQKQKVLGDQSPFAGFVAPAGALPLARSKDLAELFASEAGIKSATSNDALTNRLVMLNGLPKEQRAALLKELALAESPQLTLPDGRVEAIPILHNGYLFGGGETGLDCSSFVSGALPSDIRKSRYTTLDFQAMWTYRKTGIFPNPPTYPEKRAHVIRDAALGFIAVDVYNGEAPAAGDLLIYRNPFKNWGHAFAIRSFDPETYQAQVVEASQSAGTVRERVFQFSLDPLDAKTRYIRPGLYVLRMKPYNNRACSYKDAQAAAKPKGGAF